MSSRHATRDPSSLASLPEAGRLPVIGVTMGDPAGIGPELVLRLLADAGLRKTVRLVVFGHAGILRVVGQRAGVAWPDDVHVVAADGEPAWPRDGVPVVVDFPFAGMPEPGQVQAACGALACACIRAAVDAAMRGALDAVVTAPICKAAIQAAGFAFPGHTEMLAAWTGAKSVRMFFWSPELSVGLVTIHVALADVTGRITRAAVRDTILDVAAAVRNVRRPSPRIGVLGLNPHAGEAGLFGAAEHDAIGPAIQDARAAGVDAVGPLVPDTAFRDGARQAFDAFVAMYHDQGLIPFKLLAFDQGVNVTLGLPFCRTSPDHGTAFDIAWQGQASSASMLAAVRYAREHVLAAWAARA